VTNDAFDDAPGSALLDARPGARWPWVALIAGIAVVLIGGATYSPDEPARGQDQAAGLVIPAW
jgi:hypothetical protein